MPRVAQTLKQIELTKAMRAAVAAGLDVTRTEITVDGATTRIVLVHKTDLKAEPADAALEAWKVANARSS